MYFIAPVINILILLGYFLLADEKTSFDLSIPLWAWGVFFVYLVIVRFADGLQDTTRNIARIALLKMGESDENQQKVATIQMLLTPNIANLLAVPWIIASISSFTVLLLNGGWLLAILCATLPMLGFPWIIPKFSGHHMRAVKDHTIRYQLHLEFEFKQLGVDLELIQGILTKGIVEKRDPQHWWGNVKFKNTD